MDIIHLLRLPYDHFVSTIGTGWPWIISRTEEEAQIKKHKEVKNRFRKGYILFEFCYLLKINRRYENGKFKKYKAK
jgi:hypothetical protein